MVKLGYHPATWGRGITALKAALAPIAACGWDGLEYCGDLTADWPGTPADFRRQLDAHGLELSAVYLACSFADAAQIAAFHERVRKTASFCAEVGCSHVLIDGANRRENNCYTEEDFHRVANAANRAGELCREVGVRCSWHQHWGTMFEYQEHFDRLMALTDPALVGCTPDTAQHALGDFDVVAAVRKHAPRIGYVHFKDLDRHRRFIELGRGTVDFSGCWQALRQAAFEGWIVVDLDYTSLTPEESCRINKLYLDEILGIRRERASTGFPSGCIGQTRA